VTRPHYLFLIGVGRSGTTALRKSLWQHPDICYNGRENNVLPDIVQTALTNCTKPDRKSAMMVSQEIYDRAFERAVNEILWNEYNPSSGQIRFASFAMVPELANYLLQVFPNARILHLVRNGIEVIASRQLFVQFRDMPFEEHCKRWARTYEVYQWGQTQGDTYRLIRYEWLKDEALLREQLEQIYEWLEIPWHDAPLQHVLSERYHPTAHPKEADSTNAKRGLPESDSSQTEDSRGARWQFWTDEQRAMFETMCSSVMNAFGYPMPWQTNGAMTSRTPQKTSWLKSLYTRAVPTRRA
jgi:hypothetical protein